MKRIISFSITFYLVEILRAFIRLVLSTMMVNTEIHITSWRNTPDMCFQRDGEPYHTSAEKTNTLKAKSSI